MISWSRVAPKTDLQVNYRNRITMTSFAVRKDEERDRLFSWPEAPNDHMLAPDDVDLPDPGLFDRLSYSDDIRISGFAADISNIFHSICLPDWLVPFFPLRVIRLGNLTGEA